LEGFGFAFALTRARAYCCALCLGERKRVRSAAFSSAAAATGEPGFSDTYFEK